MQKNTGEALLKLQETISSWAQEVTETRSALTQSLDDAEVSVKPAFQLVQPALAAPPPQEQASARVVEEPAAAPKDASRDLIDANRALMRRVEGLEKRVADAERRASETERERMRLDAEIEFAREQLHLRNRAAQESEDRRSEYEVQAEEAVQALGSSELETTDLRQQLRSKDWRLLKTRNVLDMLRDDHARRVAEVEALSTQVEDLRNEVENRQASERDAIGTLEISRHQIRELEANLGESRAKADQLGLEIEAIWKALDGSKVELQEAREEIASLLAERGERNAALAELEEQMRAIAEREEAYEERLAESGTRAEELESALASQKEENASLMEHLAEERSVVESGVAELQEARDSFAKLQTDYDDLILSNGVLRDEFKELQERLAERELAVSKARRELAEANQGRQQLIEQGSEASGRIDEMTAALKEKTASLEAGRRQFSESESAAALRVEELTASLESGRQELIESESAADRRVDDLSVSLEVDRQAFLLSESDSGRRLDELNAVLQEKTQAYEQSQQVLEELRERAAERDQLERALRGELAELRDKQETAGTDQASLIRALREELESMRQVSVERDFVIHHTEAEVVSMSRQEAEMEEALQKALETSERVRAEAAHASQTQRTLEVEISELRAQGQEKDTSMRELCDELKVLRERMRHLMEDGIPAKKPLAGASAMPAAKFAAGSVARLDKALARLRHRSDDTEESGEGGWGKKLKRLWKPSKSASKQGKD